MESFLQFTEPFCQAMLEATGSWIFCAQGMWIYNKATIKFAAAVFISGIQQHGHEFYNETIVLVKETL